MNRLKVLLVDDSEIELNIIGNALQHADIDFMAVSDSSTAMDIIRSYMPTIVILDINMPDIDGIELCSKIKTDPFLNDIRVIFMTASDNIEDLVKGVRLQVVDYIQKPIPVKQLLEHILVHDLTISLKKDYKVFQNRIESNYSKYSIGH